MVDRKFKKRNYRNSQAYHDSYLTDSLGGNHHFMRSFREDMETTLNHFRLPEFRPRYRTPYEVRPIVNFNNIHIEVGSPIIIERRSRMPP